MKKGGAQVQVVMTEMLAGLFRPLLFAPLPAILYYAFDEQEKPPSTACKLGTKY